MLTNCRIQINVGELIKASGLLTLKNIAETGKCVIGGLILLILALCQKK